MRGIEFITGHVNFNGAYNEFFQLKTTKVRLFWNLFVIQEIIKINEPCTYHGLQYVFKLLRYGPGICVKYFLSFSQKICHQRKIWQTKFLVFHFWVMKLTKTSISPNLQVTNGFFVKTVNFITQKSKSKHFICLSFLCCQGFLRERDKIFYTYSGPWASHTSSAKVYSPNYHHPLLRAPLDFQTLRRPC